MGISNGYTTLALVRAELGITDGTDTTDDTKIERAVEAVSRWIDQETGTRFYTTSSDESRYYTAEFGDTLFVPFGIVSLTTLATDADGDRTYESTWAATDFDLLPFNAALDSKPYTRIEVTPSGRYSFPTHAKAVKLTGKFGYASSAPTDLAAACILRSVQIFKRKDAIYGVSGASPFGQLLLKIPPDPDVERVLSKYRTLEVL